MQNGRRFSRGVLITVLLLFALFAAIDANAENGLDYFNGPPGSVWAVLHGPHSSAYSVKMELGHYIVAGTQWSEGLGPPPWGEDIWAVLLKLNSETGTVIYYHPVMDPLHPEDSTAALSIDIVPRTDGIGHDGYIVTGLKWQHHTGPGDHDFYQRGLWIMRTDVDGNFAWDRTHGGLGDHWGNTVVADYDDGSGAYDLVIGGRQADTANLIAGGWLLRTDGTGTPEVDVDMFTDPVNPDYGWLSHEIHAARPVPGGGYIAATDRGIVRASEDGTFLWRAGTEAYYSVIAASDGGFVGVGTRERDLLLTKIDSSGTEEWSRTFGEEDPLDSGRAVIQTSGGYAIAGTTRSYGHGGADMWLIKTNADGDMEWDLVLGGPGDDQAYDVMEDMTDPGYVLVGNAEHDGSDHMWVVKTGTSFLPPVPAFTYSPDSPVFVTQRIDFTASASSDSDGTIVSYAWDFGDGGTDTGLTPHHAFAATGDYTVTLTVTDDDDISRSASQVITVIGPIFQWEREIGGTGWDVGYDLVEAWDGGLVITGYSTSTPSYAGSADVWLLKTDTEGNVVWERRFADHDGNPALAEYGHAIARTPDEGYIVAGVKGLGMAGSDYSDLWLIKTDGSGTPSWRREYGGDFNDEGLSVAPVPAPAGGYIVGGMTSAGGLDRDFWLIRTDAAGVMEWEQIYDEPLPDVCNAVAPTRDSGFIATGNYTSTGDGPLPLIKTDSDGTQIWSQEWTNSFPDDIFGYWTAQTDDDGYVVAGTYERQMSLVKTDASGTKLWERFFDGGGSEAYGFNAAVTSDGGFIIVGSRPVSGVNDDVYIVKTDAEGNLLWDLTVGTTTTYDTGHAVLPLAGGGYVILASRTPMSSGGKSDVWLFRIGSGWPSPSADFTADPRFGAATLTVNFTDATVAGTPPYTYEWDLDGDGGSDDATAGPNWTYSDPGIYDVSLTVTDDHGMTDTESKTGYIIVAGIMTDAAGVTVVDASVTTCPMCDPGRYDLSEAPPGVDLGSALAFTLGATGPDGTYRFRIVFENPVTPGMVLYKLPAWEEIPYTIIDDYTIEIELTITDGVVDPPFVLAQVLTGPGDVNGDRIVNLADAVLSLQLAGGMSVVEPVTPAADINFDGYIGLAEAIYSLQKTAGLRAD